MSEYIKMSKDELCEEFKKVLQPEVTNKCNTRNLK